MARRGRLPRTVVPAPMPREDQRASAREQPSAARRGRTSSGREAKGLPAGALLRIDEYLLACFQWESPPRVGELARTLGLTSDRFMETFRRATGVAPSTYLKDLQVTAAKLILLKTDMPIDKVGYATCFGTRRTFFREFRRLTGMSPSSFRKRP